MRLTWSSDSDSKGEKGGTLSKLLKVLALVGAVASVTMVFTTSAGARPDETSNLLANPWANDGLDGWVPCAPDGRVVVKVYGSPFTPDTSPFPFWIGAYPFLWNGNAGAGVKGRTNKCIAQYVDLTPHAALLSHPHAGYYLDGEFGSDGATRDGGQAQVCFYNNAFGTLASSSAIGRAAGQNSNNKMWFRWTVGDLSAVHAAFGAPEWAWVFIDLTNNAAGTKNTGSADDLIFSLEDNP